ENSAGGAACEDPLLPYQDAASHHALEVRDVDTPIDDLRWKERRYDRRSVPRNQPARLLVAEDGAADRVDGENLSLEVIGPSVFRAAPNRSAGARSAKQEVDFAVQRRRDLAHRLMVGNCVVDVGVLIRPEAVGDDSQKLLDPIEANFQKLVGDRMRL